MTHQWAAEETWYALDEELRQRLLPEVLALVESFGAYGATHKQEHLARIAHCAQQIALSARHVERIVDDAPQGPLPAHNVVARATRRFFRSQQRAEE